MKYKSFMYFIGNSRASGAENRMFLTALYHAKESPDSVSISLRESLYEIFIKKYGIKAFSDFKSVIIVKDLINGKKNSLKYLFSLSYLPFKVVFPKPDVLYFAIANLFYYPFLPFFKNVCYEVTSPDIARARKVKWYSRLYPNIKFVCVSENVCLVLKENIGAVRAESSIYRHHPFTGILGNENSKAKNSSGDKKNHVVFAHRLIDRKNPLFAARAFCRVANDHPDWKFFIYGRGPLEKEVKSAVEQCGLVNVIFCGFCENLSDVLDESKIFVSLIEPDNFPSQSIFEAMRASNALVVLDSGLGSKNLILNNGYLIKKDLNEICKKISDSIAMSSGFGKGSLVLSESRFSPVLYLEEHLDIVNSESIE